MSFYLADENGYVGDLATNTGLAGLSSYIEENGGDNLKKLFKEGSVKVSDALIKELKDLETPKDKDVARTLSNFIGLVLVCDNIAIITSGI